ncbi:hypothetical protein PIB30_055737 [Stylosanthes scabra]|uniref:Uncharacterized protein n=1 Tax=Stylosanthes scabra TaxID=79078 RepID=A0ABU6RJL3_9FABA|nr:hypothetical protein [Stylosanthes scabra]
MLSTCELLSTNLNCNQLQSKTDFPFRFLSRTTRVLLGILVAPCDTFLKRSRRCPQGIRDFQNYNDETPRPERARHVFGAVAGEAEYLSHSSPGSLLFDPKIERTLRPKRRAELARLALNKNPFSDSSSDSYTQSSSSVSGTSTMAKRLTLK